VYDTSEAVAHTQSVKRGLEVLLSTMVDAETGERGFIITGMTSYLEPYESARNAISPEIAQVRAMTADNPEQQADLDRLSAAAEVKVGELAEAIRQRRESGFAAAQAMVMTNVGKRTMDGIRVIVSRMDAREDGLLATRIAQAAQSYRSAQATRLATTGLALVVVIALFYNTRRLGAERQRAAHTAERFRVTLASIGDAVIATDDQGRVTQLNAVAEALTGWTAADAVGRRLEEVFVIINEESRRPAENPIGRVLRERVIVGLANHTLLISKDGREIPVDDSAAPIKTADGHVAGVVMVFRDVTERRRSERERATLIEAERVARVQAEAAEQRLRVALEAGRMGTWQWTIGSGELRWSPGLEAIHGYAPGSFPGTFEAFEKEVHPDDHDRVLTTIAEAVDQRRDHDIEYRIVRADGTVRWVEGRGQLFCDADGKPDQLVGVCSDVTERKQAAEAEREAKREAEEANRTKDQFLAMVSHELRTPLNAILGWTDMLRSGMLPDARRVRALSAVYVNATRQTKLIDELLDVSRIMAGKLRLERTAIDLPAVVRNAVDVVQPGADTKRIHIAVETDPSLGPFYADPSRLQQILVNLLANAVKFTPDGGTVHVRLRRAGGGVEFVVADTGQGIPPGFLPAVFEPFRQADGSTTRRHGGLGLGLSIVRHLVEAHGGTVSAESGGEGQGSTFTVRLPIVAVDAEHVDAAAASPSLPGLSVAGPTLTTLHGILVLVVDDDADSRELLAATLEHYGAVVLTVASAEQALDILQKTPVQVLLADIAMPSEDGYSLIRKVRALETPGTPHVAAAALTSLAREEDRREALQAGFQLHFAKPIDSRSLVEAVASLVDRMESR
jgi:PAS domain S-box-containing protein